MNHRVALMTLKFPIDDKRIYSFMAKALSRAGWRVEIINPIFGGKDSDKVYFRKTEAPASLLMKKIFYYKSFLNALLESRADIAVICDAGLLKILPKAKRILPIQVIFDAGRTTDKGGLLLKQKLELADAVITDSDDKAEIIMKWYERSCTVIRGECDADMLISLCDELEKGGRYNI